MNIREYVIENDWRDVDTDKWFARWPNFSPREMADRDTSRLKIEVDFMDKLQNFRTHVGQPLIIPLGARTAYRTPLSNQKAGGGIESQHIEGRAADIQIPGGKWGHESMIAGARAVGMTGIGIYDTFIHVDNRPGDPAFWDERTKP